jgi:8-oxo-dGTP pyrophosphatase MutT (NUDIX family)
MDLLGWLIKPEYNLQTYRGAGCIFTDGKQVLGGYQPKGPYISGLGGNRENGEDYHQTAIRETVEELFDATPSEQLIYQLQSIPYSKHLMNGSYVALVYSFNDLNTFMEICKIYLKVSTLYEKFPETLLELLLNRRPNHKIEVHDLYILPLNSNLHIDKNFLKDLSQL